LQIQRFKRIPLIFFCRNLARRKKGSSPASHAVDTRRESHGPANTSLVSKRNSQAQQSKSDDESKSSRLFQPRYFPILAGE